MEHENTTIGDSLYDWRYDLNGDGAINLTDQDIVTASSNWGHSITYLVAGNCMVATMLIMISVVWKLILTGPEGVLGQPRLHKRSRRRAVA